MNKASFIPNRLKNVSKEHPYVAGALDIIDDVLKKNLEIINSETYGQIERIYNAIAALEPELQEAINISLKNNNNEARIGYYVCESNSASLLKSLFVPNYMLTSGGCIKIKMINTNTANDVLLNISGTGLRPLYYDGEPVSATNTWDANEIVEVYYDGDNYYANNVSGGGKFLTGEKVRRLGIDDEPILDSPNLVTSGGIASTNGYCEDNPEFLRVYLDSEGRIIKGIKKDGTVYMSVGYSVNDILVTTIDCPEFLKVYLDSNNKILLAIKSNGDILFGIGIPTLIKEFILQQIDNVVELILEVSNRVGLYEDNPEFIKVITDNNGKILEGNRIGDGTKYIPVPIQNDAAIIKAENGLEYLSVTIDSNNKIINSIDKDLEDVRYGGINISELKRDNDAENLQVQIDIDTLKIYTIENEDSTITIEIDDNLNVYEVKDSKHNSLIVMEDNGDIYLEQNIKEI